MGFAEVHSSLREQGFLSFFRGRDPGDLRAFSQYQLRALTPGSQRVPTAALFASCRPSCRIALSFLRRAEQLDRELENRRAAPGGGRRQARCTPRLRRCSADAAAGKIVAGVADWPPRDGFRIRTHDRFTRRSQRTAEL